MTASAISYQINEIDPSDNALLTRFVAFENAHRNGRKRTAGERHSLMDAMYASLFLVAAVDGTWVAVLNGSTQEVDGGANVQVQTAVRSGDEAALAVLFDRVSDWHATALAESMVSHLPDPTEDELRIWTGMGFARAGMRKGWRLRLSGDSNVALPNIPGVRVISLAQHPYLAESAHQAWCDAYRAIPDELVSDAVPSFESWHAELLRDGDGSLPESLLIAVDTTERVIGVGYLHIHTHPSGSAGHRFTGVVSDWRGRGVARLLKASQIAWAARNGITELRGSNNERNHAMLHINEQLGYEPTSTIVMMRRALPRRTVV